MFARLFQRSAFVARDPQPVEFVWRAATMSWFTASQSSASQPPDFALFLRVSGKRGRVLDHCSQTLARRLTGGRAAWDVDRVMH